MNQSSIDPTCRAAPVSVSQRSRRIDRGSVTKIIPMATAASPDSRKGVISIPVKGKVAAVVVADVVPVEVFALFELVAEVSEVFGSVPVDE